MRLRKGPQRRPQRRLGRRLEGVAKAVAGGYCRLQMPLKLALGVRGTVAGHRLGVPERGGRGGVPPPLPMHPCSGAVRSGGGGARVAVTGGWKSGWDLNLWRVQTGWGVVGGSQQQAAGLSITSNGVRVGLTGIEPSNTLSRPGM